MATETTNYHFIKPSDTDPVDNTPLNQNFDSIDAAIADHVADTNNPHQVTKEQVGLGNVDNTADIDKPVSSAALAALSEKVDKETGKGLSTNDFTTAEKEKLAAIDERVKTNENNISIANRRKVYVSTENNTSYIFSDLYGLNDSRFKYALVCGGGTANNPALAMLWFVFIDDSGVVTARKIIGDSTRTLTGSVSGATLTLTSDSAVYGGLRLIWLS